MFKEYYANVMLPSLVCWKKGYALEKRENSLMIYYFFNYKYIFCIIVFKQVLTVQLMCLALPEEDPRFL